MILETVTLVLITEDDCVGIQQFHRVDSVIAPVRPMRWVGESDAPTREAIIEDVLGIAYSMDGDAWRQVEKTGQFKTVLCKAFSGRLSQRLIHQLSKVA